MDYELAKQLEQAGFPQAGQGRWIGPADQLIWRAGEKVYVPTLEELIEALPAGVLRLTRYPNTYGAAYGEYMDQTANGRTAGEALARLWLANQKEKAR